MPFLRNCTFIQPLGRRTSPDYFTYYPFNQSLEDSVVDCTTGSRLFVPCMLIYGSAPWTGPYAALFSLFENLSALIPRTAENREIM